MTATVPAEQRMANDIARAFAHLPEPEAVEAVAGHIGRFWDPRMRSRLWQLAEGSGADGLDPVVVSAVRLLKPPDGGG